MPAVLLGLFAVHAAVDAFLSPIGGAVGQIDAWAIVRVAAMGVTIVQPALLAIGAVLWPTRAAIRITVTLTATVLLAYATLFGIARNANQRVAVNGGELGMMIIQYFVFAAVLSLAARLWHWQMFPQAAPSRFADRQFSLYGLVVAVTVAGLVFGLGNSVLSLAAWPDSLALWQAYVIRALLTALVVTVPCLPIIPCAWAVLAPGPRGWRFAWALGSVTATGTLFVVVLISLGPQQERVQDIAILSSVLLGGYGSALLSLLAVRLCGLTLARRFVDQGTPDV